MKYSFKSLTLSILLTIFILLSILSINDNRYLLKADTQTVFNNIFKEFKNNSLNQISLNMNDEYLIEVNNTFIDKRAYILDLYFKENNSPLLGTGKLFSDYCDLYGAPKDCTTVVAIAKHETDLCKYQYSSEMYNCWGFGGGSEHRITFSSFSESIERVTRVLSEQYGYRYMVDPRLMESVFCGTQSECSGWGSRILAIMNDLNNFSIAKGNGSLFDLRK